MVAPYGWIVIASALDAENAPGGHGAGELAPNHTNCAVSCRSLEHYLAPTVAQYAFETMSPAGFAAGSAMMACS